MPAIETTVRVRYAETDQMGVVYHSNYFVWMEVGRIELCRAGGISYRDMEAEGVLLAVVEANCRYLAPARYDDQVTVRTWIEAANTRMVRFAYEMTCQSRTLAAGFTRHVFLDRAMRPARLPAKYRALFGIQPGAGSAACANVPAIRAVPAPGSPFSPLPSPSASKLAGEEAERIPAARELNWPNAGWVLPGPDFPPVER